MTTTPKAETAQVFARQGNTALVQLHGRRLPAVAIQGDTLEGLLSDCKELLKAAEAGDVDEARALVDIIEQSLRPGLDAYAEAVRRIEASTTAAE